jgi:hypothetical protein
MRLYFKLREKNRIHFVHGEEAREECPQLYEEAADSTAALGCQRHPIYPRIEEIGHLNPRIDGGNDLGQV